MCPIGTSKGSTLVQCVLLISPKKTSRFRLTATPMNLIFSRLSLRFRHDRVLQPKLQQPSIPVPGTFVFVLLSIRIDYQK